MSKRNKFLIFSTLLTLFLTLLPFFPSSFLTTAVSAFTIISGLFAVLCLWDYLSAIEYVTLLTLPVMFSLGMGSIILQFPNFSGFFRTILYGVYFLTYYILLLSLNIFNVAGEKPIPLLRAAYTSSFLVTTFTAFPIFTLLYKGSTGIIFEIILVFIITFLLSFQSVWSVFLPKSNVGLSLRTSLIVSILMTQTAFVFSFFPMESFFRSLLLSTFFYILLGFSHQYLKKTINGKSIFEYAFVGLVIVVLVFLY